MEEKVVCLDTCVLFGEGRKRAREIKRKKKRKTEIKEDGILNKIKEKTDSRLTTIITSYEFLRQLAIEEGISLDKCRKIYEEIKSEFEIIEIIPNPKEIKLSADLMNQLCNLDLDLADGLQILIASKRKLPFITGESEKKKLPNMKKFYNKVYSVKEFLQS